MDDEEKCPKGDLCPICRRVDEVTIDDAAHHVQLITYSGDYAVVTGENSELSSELCRLLARVAGRSLDRFETLIYHVGDGTLKDLSQAEPEIKQASLRYAKTHDEWKWVRGIHDVTVSALQASMIDVSNPL